MREIKFRAWHKGSGQYPPTMLMEEYPGQSFQWLHDKQPIELMQFTGLFDKHGKEIYEGDIVRYSKADVCLIPAEVYWDEVGCQFRLATGGDKQFDKTRMIQFARIGEVIGNIYEGLYSGENPELLEVK